MPKLPHANGVTSLSGERWMVVTQGDRVAYVPYTLCAGPNAAPVIRELAEQGIVIVGKAQTDKFAQVLASIDDFPPGNLVDRAGWSSGIFVLPDGTAFAPEEASHVTVVFPTTHLRFGRSGSLKTWKHEVAAPLTRHALGAFVLSLAFVAPLLELYGRTENFGFEIVGKQGCGKSTLQRLMSSVYGPPDQYGRTWNTTLNALESELPLHEGLTMVLDEANLFFAGQSHSKRAANFTAFAFQASAGSQKKRFGQAARGGFRFAYLSSSNEPLSVFIGEGDVANAASDRLITIPVGPDRPYGVFDTVPDDYVGSSALARALIEAARQNHGHAIRRFLKRLVIDRGVDEATLRAKISHHVSEFQRVAGIDMNDGSKVRVAEAFGLVYAAGRLAIGYGALDGGFNCGRAVETCYRLATEARSVEPPLDRLKGLADGLMSVDVRKLEKLSAKKLAKVGVFLSGKGARRELWLRRDALDEHFPDWRSIRLRSDIQAALVRDKDRHEVYRKIGEKRERVFCFRLPPKPRDK